MLLSLDRGTGKLLTRPGLSNLFNSGRPPLATWPLPCTNQHPADKDSMGIVSQFPSLIVSFPLDFPRDVTAWRRGVGMASHPKDCAVATGCKDLLLTPSPECYQSLPPTAIGKGTFGDEKGSNCTMGAYINPLAAGCADKHLPHSCGVSVPIITQGLDTGNRWPAFALDSHSSSLMSGKCAKSSNPASTPDSPKFLAGTRCRASVMETAASSQYHAVVSFP